MDKKQSFDFAKAMAEIETINHWFQDENINLDEGLVRFRKGLELIKECQKKLKQVENEFVEIKKELVPDDQLDKNE